MKSVISVARLAACGLAAFIGIAASVPAQAQQRQSIIDRIQRDGVLKVCVAISSPWMMKDPASDKFIGFDVEMIEMLAKEMEVRAELVGFPAFGQLIAGLQAGRCDMIAPFVRTTRRAVAVAFSEPYFTLGSAWVVHKDRTKAETLADLNKPEITVAVEQGALSEQRTKKHLPNAVTKSLPGGGDGLRMAEVQSGRSQAAALDSIKVPTYQVQFPWAKFIPADAFTNPVDPSGLAYAVRRDDLDFVNLLNIFIWNLRANGTIDQLTQKWIDPKWIQLN